MNALRRRAIMVLVATVLGTALTAWLGHWQLSRAAQKEALQTELEAREVLPELDMNTLAVDPQDAALQHFRRIRLRGEWKDQATVFLDNRQMNGRPGFIAVTPLKLAASNDAVLVQRGWAPRDMRERTWVPVVPTPEGEVEVYGSISPPPGRLFDFGGASSGPIRQNLDIADFSREFDLSLRPLSILQTDFSNTGMDGLLRHWSRPAADVHKHYGYAFQWFALSILIAGLYVWFQLIRPRLQTRA